MSPEPPPPEQFGRTPAAAARGAVILALLGCGIVAVLVRVLSRPGTLPGEAFLATGIPPAVVLALGTGGVLALAVYGYVRSVRTRDLFRLSPAGLEDSGPSLGEYTLEWENIREARVIPGSLGVSVRRREAVAETHRGTERQRDLLRTMEPYGEFDFLYPQADLGHPPETVLGWMAPYLKRDERG